VPEEYYQQWEDENKAQAAAEKAIAGAKSVEKEAKEAEAVSVKETDPVVEKVAEPKPAAEGAAKRKVSDQGRGQDLVRVWGSAKRYGCVQLLLPLSMELSSTPATPARRWRLSPKRWVTQLPIADLCDLAYCSLLDVSPRPCPCHLFSRPLLTVATLQALP